MVQYLSAEQKQFYQENGYLVLQGHLPAELVTRARSEIARLSEHA